jgi:hypothetical protein
MTRPASALVARDPHVLERRFGGSVLVMRRRSGQQIQRLEGVTAATWSFLVAPTSVGELIVAAQGAAAGAASPDEVASAIHEAVSVLERSGLVTVDRSGAARPGDASA